MNFYGIISYDMFHSHTHTNIHSNSVPVTYTSRLIHCARSISEVTAIHYRLNYYVRIDSLNLPVTLHSNHRSPYKELVHDLQ